jgi:hypothetical protein
LKSTRWSASKIIAGCNAKMIDNQLIVGLIFE